MTTPAEDEIFRLSTRIELLKQAVMAERANSEGLRKALAEVMLHIADEQNEQPENSGAAEWWKKHAAVLAGIPRPGDPRRKAFLAALSASPSPRRQLTQEEVDMFDAALHASTTVVHDGELVPEDSQAQSASDGGER